MALQLAQRGLAASTPLGEVDVSAVGADTVEMTAPMALQPGDVVYCNPGVLHAAAPNATAEPRFMRVKFLMMA